MTIDVLLAQLQILKAAGLPGTARILLSSDSEGNQINDLDSHNFEWAIEEEDGWRLLDPEDLNDYSDEELEEVLVLWP